MFWFGDITMFFVVIFLISSLITRINGGGTLTLSIQSYDENEAAERCTSNCAVSFKIELRNGLNITNISSDRRFDLRRKIVISTDKGSGLFAEMKFEEWTNELTYRITVVKINDDDKEVLHQSFQNTKKLELNKTLSFTSTPLSGDTGIRLTGIVIAKCDIYYYKPCNKYCKGADDVNLGFYRCNKNGDKICQKGYMNPSSNCIEKDRCHPNPCENGGKCLQYETVGASRSFCVCASWYRGFFCNSRKRACDVFEPCLNGGQCINVGVRDRTCICQKGFRGLRCETIVNPCDKNPCQNNGLCTQVKPERSHLCICAKGFTGTDCNTDIDECSEHPKMCRNNGTCVNTFGNYHCDCAAGFEGPHCKTCIVHMIVNGRCRPDLEFSTVEISWILIVAFTFITTALVSYVFLFLGALGHSSSS